jgi:hypothetical protein
VTVFVVPRETNEAVPFTFALNGTNLVSGVTYQIVAKGSRPTGTWISAVTWNGNYPCFVMSGVAAGRYSLFAQTTSSPYTPTRYIGDVISD